MRLFLIRSVLWAPAPRWEFGNQENYLLKFFGSGFPKKRFTWEKLNHGFPSKNRELIPCGPPHPTLPVMPQFLAVLERLRDHQHPRLHRSCPCLWFRFLSLPAPSHLFSVWVDALLDALWKAAETLLSHVASVQTLEDLVTTCTWRFYCYINLSTQISGHSGKCLLSYFSYQECTPISLSVSPSLSLEFCFCLILLLGLWQMRRFWGSYLDPVFGRREPFWGWTQPYNTSHNPPFLDELLKTFMFFSLTIS